MSVPSTPKASDSTSSRHHHWSYFQQLLFPLYQAGWQTNPFLRPTARTHPQRGPILKQDLVRTGMAIQAVYYPQTGIFFFEPPASRPHVANPFAALSMTATLPSLHHPEAVASEHGPIEPFMVEDLARSLGLLDPTRFMALPGQSPHFMPELIQQAFGCYVSSEALAWFGPHPGQQRSSAKTTNKRQSARQLVVAYFGVLRALAPNVLPDPVPRTAAIGLASDCWRHTPIEEAHASNPELTDTVMAKLNIMATKHLAHHITAKGVNWAEVTAYLTDHYRELPDGRPLYRFTAEHWPAIRAAVEDKLLAWQQVEQLIGPEATLRLLALAGSTPHTANWYGNGWWPVLCRQVTANLEKHRIELPPSYEHAGDELAIPRLTTDLIHQPERLPDEVLSLRALIRRKARDCGGCESMSQQSSSTNRLPRAGWRAEPWAECGTTPGIEPTLKAG